MREAARAGAGIAPLPTFIAEPVVATGDLLPVLPNVRMPVGRLSLIYPASGRVAPKVTAFCNLLLATMHQPTAA